MSEGFCTEEKVMSKLWVEVSYLDGIPTTVSCTFWPESSVMVNLFTILKGMLASEIKNS